MRKTVLLVVLLVVLLGTSVAYALETTTYSGWASYSKPFRVTITTYADGDIFAHAMFDVSSHNGGYALHIYNSLGNLICLATLDVRWGRATVGDMTCSAYQETGLLFPPGQYTVEFYPTNSKVYVTLEISAETGP